MKVLASPVLSDTVEFDASQEER